MSHLVSSLAVSLAVLIAMFLASAPARSQDNSDRPPYATPRAASSSSAKSSSSPSSATNSSKRSAAEQSLFDAVNRERSAQGLPMLKWDPALAVAARRHAQLMVQKNQLSHQFSGEPRLDDRARSAGARFHVIAENVAEARSAEELHSVWMNSAPHRANILDKDVDSIGIAVIQGNKFLFAVEDFSQAAK